MRLQRQRETPRHLHLEDVAGDDVVERAAHPVLELVPRQIGLVVVGRDIDGDPGQRRRPAPGPPPRWPSRSSSMRVERPRVRRLQADRIVAVHAAREQQPVLRVVEDGDRVEDGEPLARQCRGDRRRSRGSALVPPRCLVGEEADGAAEQRRRHPRRAGGAERRDLTIEHRRAGRRRRPVSLITRDGPWPSIDQRATAPLPSTDSSRKQLASVPSARIAATGVASPIGQLEHHRDDVVVSEAAPRLLEPGNRLVHRRRAMEVSSGHRGADVLRDAARRLLEVGDRGRVAETDMPGAVPARRTAGKHRDADLVEQRRSPARGRRTRSR